MPSLNKWSRKRLVFLRKLILRNNVALASFPRSGNTWLSQLLEALSGQQAGSIYRDHVFPRPATGIVIKTHKCDGQRFNRIVHLVRSPLDSISSHFDYMHRYFPQRAQDWRPHVATQTHEWKRHTAYWMQQAKPRITVRYEDLMAEPFAELRKLAEFLHLDVDDGEIEQAVEACEIDRLREASSKRGEDAAGFFRKGGSGHGINRYSADEIATIEAELGELMAKFGYEIPTRS
ncbi:MAG: sulfotransferase domain-containing protein [Deltaproteobacteria bacterium]|nr:sulfotransferase domain-containing protein [Deltaproteobacteria bacterium]